MIVAAAGPVVLVPVSRLVDRKTEDINHEYRQLDQVTISVKDTRHRLCLEKKMVQVHRGCLLTLF